MAIHVRRANRTLGMMTLSFLLMMTVTTQGVATTRLNNQSAGMAVPDCIFACYDGHGYADYPGGGSTLKSSGLR